MEIVREKDVISALRAKHSEDVFVHHCKDGQSNRGLSIMDAWVMAKSWARPRVIVYEVKVSRSDFMNDTKWPNYLPYCNELYFACPAKLIQPSEIPEGVGLVWMSAKGTRIYTKKKASYREVAVPEGVYRYILMARVGIDVGRYSNSFDECETFWQGWLERKGDLKELGHKVSSRISKLVDEIFVWQHGEQKRQEQKIKALESVEEMLEKIGVSPYEYNVVQRAREKMDHFLSIIPDGMDWQVDNLIKNLQHLKEKMKRH